jgi:hypothetical protein
MCRLLIAQGSAQNPRETQERRISAGQAIGTTICADQFALNAERRGLQGNEMNVLERGAINRLTKHECISSRRFGEAKGKQGERNEEVAELVPHVENLVLRSGCFVNRAGFVEIVCKNLHSLVSKDGPFDRTFSPSGY